MGCGPLLACYSYNWGLIVDSENAFYKSQNSLGHSGEVVGPIIIIDYSLIIDWLRIGWLMINDCWMMDDWLIFDWWLIDSWLMINWWLIDDCLMINW